MSGTTFNDTTCHNHAPVRGNPSYIFPSPHSWSGYLIESSTNQWAALDAQNCSYFDASPASCAAYKWNDGGQPTTMCWCAAV